jgi:hypothetical protein
MVDEENGMLVAFGNDHLLKVIKGIFRCTHGVLKCLATAHRLASGIIGTLGEPIA